jgi:hypothetical protein
MEGTPIDREKLLSLSFMRRGSRTRTRDRQESLAEEVAENRTVDGVPIHEGKLGELVEEYQREHN